MTTILTSKDIGKTFLLILPPGWILIGTLLEVVNGSHVTLKDGVYLEGVKSDSSLALTTASTRKRQEDIAGNRHPLRDGHRVAMGYIGQAVECVLDVQPWARIEAAKAIKGAR